MRILYTNKDKEGVGQLSKERTYVNGINYSYGGGVGCDDDHGDWWLVVLWLVFRLHVASGSGSGGWFNGVDIGGGGDLSFN